MNSESRDVISEMFAGRVSNALEWFNHARSLLAAARATKQRADVLIDVWERSDLNNVATMLYGFSLENLFKAKWVLNKFGSPYEEGWELVAEFPAELKTHDLLKLGRLIDSELPDKYEFALTLLSDAATWSGRYPCSLKGDEGTIGRWSDVNEVAEKLFKTYSEEFTSVC